MKLCKLKGNMFLTRVHEDKFYFVFIIFYSLATTHGTREGTCKFNCF